MAPDRRRLARLHRLERVRALARDTAAREVADAESTLAQLEALIARTQTIRDDYRAARPGDGLALRQIGQFVAGLSGVTASTSGNAGQARALADRKQADLAAAERRRAAVEDRLAEGKRALLRGGQVPALGARRGTGTGLE